MKTFLKKHWDSILLVIAVVLFLSVVVAESESSDRIEIYPMVVGASVASNAHGFLSVVVVDRSGNVWVSYRGVTGKWGGWEQLPQLPLPRRRQ